MTKVDRDPLHLYPRFRDRVMGFLDIWNGSHPSQPVGIFEGLRSFERQAELYAIGRTADGVPCTHQGVIRPLGTCALHPRGKVVTLAPPGLSWHAYGLAVDIVFDSNPTKPDLQASWDNSFPWGELAECGKSCLLEPAAYWSRMPEFPHFQQTFGMQLVEAHAFYQQGGLPAVWKGITNEILEAG